MKATKRSVVRAGLVVCSVLTLTVTGCRTHVVHSHTRTVHVAPPPPIVHTPPGPASSPAPVVHVTPAPVPQPPPPAVVVTPPAQAPVVVIQSVNDFYEPLAAHGRWVVLGSYGRCWIPAQVEAGWRPYSNGYWQRTDAGWYWMSDEPWGWATYHYGRWDWHAGFGWVWVPHTQWAPAWVAWREGGGYVGWAPLRPSVTFGVSITTVEYEPAFASRAFVFVEHRRMLEPVRPKTVVVNNTTIINKTVNITNVKMVNKTVINEGPRLDTIERASGRKVQAVPVNEFRRREETVVAARQRAVPSAERNLRLPEGRTIQAAPREVAPLLSTPVVEKPSVNPKPSVAVIRPSQPAAPARPSSPLSVLPAPARVENKPKSEAPKAIVTTPPANATPARPEVRPVRAVAPQPEIRSVEKPSVTTKPTALPPAANPVGNEKKPAVETVKPVTATIPIVAPTTKSEVKPVRAVSSQRELRPVAKPVVTPKPTPQLATPSAIEAKAKPVVGPVTRPATPTAVSAPSARPTPAKIQTAPSTERSAVNRQIPAREESRVAEPTAAIEKKTEVKTPIKKVESQENRLNAARLSR